MSFTAIKTFELWSSFMPQRKHIPHTIDQLLYSLEVYPPVFFQPFNPAAEFMKWAAVEVSTADTVPDGMELLELPAGKYAVFLHKGPASNAKATYDWIFLQWLPASGCTLDERPHYAVMGERYKKDDPSSEEEIWIPVQ